MEITYREAIVEAIKNIAYSVDGIEYAEVDRGIAVNIDSVPLASCFVYAGPESRVTADNEATLGYETWDFVVLIEMWAFSKDIETLLGRIHGAINDNRYLTISIENNLVPDCQYEGRLLSGTGIKRSGADPQYFEVTNEKKAMIISFIARYNHTIGDMFVPQN